MATGTLAAGERAATSERLLLWTLLAVYVLNFLDRQIVTILAEPISRDLGLSDTQMGLMTGLAFALFYAVLGIPIARYADRPQANRVGLISVSLLLWSGMTAVCGLAQTFGQLLMARVGVGVGEAGCTPAAHSLIADAVPAERRAGAIAFYGMGIPIGSLLGMVIGGLLSDAVGWRSAFFVVGMPGILLAGFVWFALRDPRKAGVVSRVVRPEISAGAALREVFSSRAFVLLAVASGLVAFLGYGKTAWSAIFFIRSFGLSPGETGLTLGIAAGLASLFGTWLGGWVSDRFARVNKRHMLTGPAVGMVVAAPILFAAYNATSWQVALLLLIVPTVFNSMYYGPAYAAVQGLVRPEVRAVATATLVFAQNLIGLGLGPLFFGMMSDAFKPMAGAESVRWVLWGAAWLGLLPAFFFWRASLRLKGEQEAVTARAALAG